MKFLIKYISKGINYRKKESARAKEEDAKKSQIFTHVCKTSNYAYFVIQNQKLHKLQLKFQTAIVYAARQ